MDQTVLPRADPKTAAECKAVVADILNEIKRLEEKMVANRVEIERLNVETRIIKAESDMYAARSRERIDALMAAL